MKKIGTGNNVILEIRGECNELPGPTETNTSEDDSVQLRSCAHLNIHLLFFG